MTAAPNPVFKFNREAFAVKIENVAESASRQDIVNLFTTLIGEVSKCEEFVFGSRRVFYMTFAAVDSAKKALCMSGYTVAGIPLAVTVSSPPAVSRGPKQGNQSDNRRNLYVLGLPFDLTKNEFVEVFSRFGAVSHAVILATVDNASRRRGFVVMGSHNEARAAIDGMSRKEIKGHTIDVSWAVVQRSQGFLDGGDRATVLDSHPASPSPSQFEFGAVKSAPSSGHVSLCSTPLPERAPTCSLLPQTSSILVSNLPGVLFSELADLFPLFCPYGDIEKLEIVDKALTDLKQGDVSVLVEYKTMSQAMDARNALNGQLYSNKPVEVTFVHKPTGTEADRDSIPKSRDMKTGLNPNAAPFVVTGLSPDTARAPVNPMYAGSNTHCQSQFSGAVPSGLLTVNSRPLGVPATPLYTHLYGPVTENLRPNSVPSPWADQGQQLRVGNQTISPFQHFPNLSMPSLSKTFAA